MVRFFPTIFPDSNLDEAAVVWACALRQHQAAARRKRRDLLFGALFALFGLIFSTVALLTQVELSGEVSTLGYLLVAGGLVVLLGGIAMMIYIWATDPGEVSGLVKGYWRLIALRYSPDAVLLWDTLGTAHASLALSGLDADTLADLTGSFPADYSTSSHEQDLLKTMKQALDLLKTVQAHVYDVAFFPMDADPGRSLAELLARTQAATPGNDYFILPPAGDLEIENLKSFVHMVAQSLEGSHASSLEAAKESVVSRTQLALESLKATPRGGTVDSEALKVVGERARLKEDLSQALEELFSPVLNELEDQAGSKLDDLERGTNESIEQIKTRFALKADQIQSEGAAWLRSLDLNIQGFKMRMDEANRDLKVGDEVGQAGPGPNGEPMLIDHEPGEKGAQIEAWEFQSDTKTTASSPGAGELRGQVDLEKERTALQSRYQKLQAERERVSKEFEQRLNTCLAERDAEIRNCEGNRERLRHETWQPIREIEAEKESLSGLLRQALEDLNPSLSDPSTAAEAILEYRAHAIESLRDEITQVLESLVARREVAKEFIRGYCWKEVDVKERADEYLIPIWFIRHGKKGHWRPFLSVCDLAARGIRPGEELGIGINDTPSRPLLILMSRQPGSGPLDEFLSSAFAAIQAEAKARLWAELEKLRRWNLIGEDLFKEMQSHSDRFEEVEA